MVLRRRCRPPSPRASGREATWGGGRLNPPPQPKWREGGGVATDGHMAVGGQYHASPVVIQAMDLRGTEGQHGVCIGAYRHRHSAGLTETLPQATPIRPSRVTDGASAPPQAPDGPCSLFGASLAPVCSPRLCLVAG